MNDQPQNQPPVEAIKGRGASDNPVNRFEELRYEFDGDWDDQPPEIGRPQTKFLKDNSRSIVASNDSPDIGFDYSMNPYRGCEHGCVYCYARPSHEYLGFSAGLDFETRIMVKENAPELLRAHLMKPSWDPTYINLSGVTDCYQPIEKKLKLTRRCLEVLLDFRNPAGIITKSRLITRDIDVLQELAGFQCVSVLVAVTSLKGELARILEPRAPHPDRRLETIRNLSEAGVPVGVMVAPIIPAINDEEVVPILKAAGEAGATYAAKVTMRLPWGLKELVAQWLEQHFPERKDKVLNRIKEMHGGKLYRSEFHVRGTGTGPYADQIANMFKVGKKLAGMTRRPPFSLEHFRRPGEREQLSLF